MLISMLIAWAPALVDVRNGSGWTPLMMACRTRKYRSQEHVLACAKLLLRAAADPNVRVGGKTALHPDRKGGYETVLHQAARDGDARLAVLLLSHGARPNVRGGDAGLTPLHYAVAAAPHKETGVLLAALIQARGDVAARAGDSSTPLARATWSSDVGWAERLNFLAQFAVDQEVRALHALWTAQGPLCITTYNAAIPGSAEGAAAELKGRVSRLLGSL